MLWVVGVVEQAVCALCGPGIAFNGGWWTKAPRLQRFREGVPLKSVHECKWSLKSLHPGLWPGKKLYDYINHAGKKLIIKCTIKCFVRSFLI